MMQAGVNNLLRGGRRVGGSTLWRVREVVGSEGRVSAGTLQGVESDAVAELCDSDDWRIVLLDKFPKACGRLV